jgi:NTE family protein
MASIPHVERALILQGGGSLGAYEVGAYKALYSLLTYRDKKEGNADRPIADIIAGTSIGAINSAILVSHVIENKTWEGSAEKLIEFWNYISTESLPEPFENYLMSWWNFFRSFNPFMGTAEAARRYYLTKQLSFMGVPKVFSAPHGEGDKKFFDLANQWYRFDNGPLKKSLETFAKFPIATRQEDNQPRLILTAVDVAEGFPVVFDSYAKKDGTRKTEYGRYIVDKKISDDDEIENTIEKEIGFEHIIRYDKGITADHVIASAAVPVSYDYVKLEADSYDPHTGNYEKNIRHFWDGGLLSNTPFLQLVTSQRQYWYQVRGLKSKLPQLQICIINLHPARHNIIPWDKDGVENRNADIMFADRSKHDENVILLLSDLVDLTKKVMEIAKDNGVKTELLEDLLEKQPASHGRLHGMKSTFKYRNMIEGQFNIGEVIRLERKHDENAIFLKIMDFSSTTIKRLIQDGYDDAIYTIKKRLGNEIVLAAGLESKKEPSP